MHGEATILTNGYTPQSTLQLHDAGGWDELMRADKRDFLHIGHDAVQDRLRVVRGIHDVRYPSTARNTPAHPRLTRPRKNQ